MAKDSLAGIRTRNTVTGQMTQAREDQVQNNAGGFTFQVAGEDRIRRFLMLGTDGGTYYQKEKEYTQQNAAVVIDWAKTNGVKLAYLLLDISEGGRAPRQNPTLFALAAVFAFGDDEAKKSAAAVFNRIVRTGTHLFIFVKYAEQFRGWGRGLKKAVGSWYLSKDANDLSYQLVKYRQREEWTHQDVLRQAHVGWKTASVDPEVKALLNWVSPGKGGPSFGGKARTSQKIERVGWAVPFEIAQNIPNIKGARKGVYGDLIREYPGLPWEALPDVALTYAETWGALIDAGMPITALIRQLPRLTNLGLTTGATGAKIIAQLTDEDKLRKGRVHPVKLLYALKTYALGHSIRGKGTWSPASKVTDALDQSFYTSFGTVEPAGKRTLMAQDVSSSMATWGWSGTEPQVVSPAEIATAMAMVSLATEPDAEIMGFADTFRHMDISPRRRLDDNLRAVRNVNFGSTDCSLPMTWALQNHKEYDTFVVSTDSETYAGRIHPHEALRQYRQKTGINARLIVVGITATEFAIADPKDPGMLDVAGFDADTPNIISGFSRGDFS